MRALFLVPHPLDGAGSRLRIGQYLAYLERRGIRADVRPFMSRRLFTLGCLKGRHAERWVRLAVSVLRRVLVLLLANRYDVVVVHRHLFPFWHPVARLLLRWIRRPIVYDFDDAPFLSDAAGGGSGKNGLKPGRSGQTAELLQVSRAVIAASESLGDHARQFGREVYVLPTPVDDEAFRPAGETSDRSRLVIGWFGGYDASPDLHRLDGVFRSLLDRFPKVEIHVVGGRYRLSGGESRVRNIPRRPEEESEALGRFDVGVSPLKGDVRRGPESGFETLFYMSMGVPVVCSPVGLNRRVVCEGVNGFFARTTEEWVERIARLLEDEALRGRVGREGRRTVEREYSLRRLAPTFLFALDGAVSAHRMDDRRFRRLQRMTQRSFDFQWTQFPDMVPANEEHFLNYIHPIKPDFFGGKRVLDAACGFGRHAYYAAGYGARRIVGLDFSDAIFSARDVNRERPNVSLVKGDIFGLPFKPASFDCIYSLGALHHLPDPEGGFHALMDYVKPGGAIAIWVYSKRRRFINRIIEGVRIFTRNIPLATLKKFSFFCACLDYFCFILPYKLLRGFHIVEARMLPRIKLYAKFPFWVNYADWFDRLSAPVRYYFDREDMRDWARRARLVNVVVSPTGWYGWRLYGERAPVAEAEPAERSIATG